MRPGRHWRRHHHFRRRQRNGDCGARRSKPPSKTEAQKAGIRYLGPNCLGILCPSSKLHASFAPHCAQPGNLAFISQSGALCSSILGWAIPKKIGFSHFISVGSMADVDFGDLIDYLGNEEKAKSIVIYMENLTQHRKFMSAARSVSRVKPIIIIKAGRSRAGAMAAASHTGAMAGADRAYNAAFRRAGIIRVDTIGQLFDCAEALGKVKRPAGGNLGIISNAGGPGVMAVDALGRWNMEPAVLSPETLEQLDEFLPPYWSRGNPIDILGDAPPERYLWAVQVAMAAPELSGLVIILSPQAMTDPTGVAQALAPEIQARAGRSSRCGWGAMTWRRGSRSSMPPASPPSRPRSRRWTPSWRCISTPATWNSSRIPRPG